MAPNYFDSINRLAGELFGTRPGLGRGTRYAPVTRGWSAFWNEGLTS